MKTIFVATDLDDTLLGDSSSLDNLNETLQDLRNKGELKLAYVTGRSLDLYHELLNSNRLLKPDVLIASVGTEIYWDANQQDKSWPNKSSYDRINIINSLKAIPGIELQPESEQRPLKISYFVQSDEFNIQAVKKILNQFNLDVVYSQNYYLDILPEGVNKGSAIKYVAKKWHIDSSQIYTFGDSANDIDMLNVGKPTIVGNSKKELLEWAKNNSSIYKANNNYAAGIIEGLSHYIN